MKIFRHLYAQVLVAIVLGLIARLHGFGVFKLLAYIKGELLIVLGLSSSGTVRSRMMPRMEEVGGARPVVGIVLPAGYS